MAERTLDARETPGVYSILCLRFLECERTFIESGRSLEVKFRDGYPLVHAFPAHTLDVHVGILACRC